MRLLVVVGFIGFSEVVDFTPELRHHRVARTGVPLKDFLCVCQWVKLYGCLLSEALSRIPVGGFSSLIV